MKLTNEVPAGLRAGGEDAMGRGSLSRAPGRVAGAADQGKGGAGAGTNARGRGPAGPLHTPPGTRPAPTLRSSRVLICKFYTRQARPVKRPAAWRDDRGQGRVGRLSLFLPCPPALARPPTAKRRLRYPRTIVSSSIRCRAGVLSRPVSPPLGGRRNTMCSWGCAGGGTPGRTPPGRPRGCSGPPAPGRGTGRAAAARRRAGPPPRQEAKPCGTYWRSWPRPP
jgi:hypothetical protein